MPGIVGGEAELNGFVADGNVRVMIGPLRQPGDLQHEGHRLDKIGALDGPGQGIPRQCPTVGRGLRHWSMLGGLVRRARPLWQSLA